MTTAEISRELLAIDASLKRLAILSNDEGDTISQELLDDLLRDLQLLKYTLERQK